MAGINKEKNTQVLLTLSHEMLERIEKHWHDNQLKNRTEAIRDLIQKGLESK